MNYYTLLDITALKCQISDSAKTIASEVESNEDTIMESCINVCKSHEKDFKSELKILLNKRLKEDLIMRKTSNNIIIDLNKSMIRIFAKKVITAINKSTNRRRQAIYIALFDEIECSYGKYIASVYYKTRSIYVNSDLSFPEGEYFSETFCKFPSKLHQYILTLPQVAVFIREHIRTTFSCPEQMCFNNQIKTYYNNSFTVFGKKGVLISSLMKLL